MLLKVSATLAKRLGCNLVAPGSRPSPFPQVWHLDLFKPSIGPQLVLASEENTLFSVLIPLGRSRDVDSFLVPFAERLSAVFADTADWQRPDFSKPALSGRTDRRISGSQNNLIYLAKVHLASLRHLPAAEALAEVEGHLNSAPMSYLDMRSAQRAFSAESE